MEDCYNAGMATTMVQRSPTYVIPMSYLLHPEGLGVYDYVPAEVGDAITQAGPLAVGGPLLGFVHAKLAEAEPDGSTLNADAIIWCTGFKNLDIRPGLSEILGGGAEHIQNKMIQE
ncbi:hypothetical protein ACMFMF_009842 [Clarireedia jacksonii]